ncbi:hypothetical protein B0T25DRAFT_522149 [Lasiosphaeria hispida]|uniref:Uncharacterized protein n=1 Tax=Lasiosphaeria hispida TaxID=260671 RepID=A0AAJ0H999_9PEZI|nr:hypothetical protein B0T25DRAFT_522149 [Lasiosphaeria hispida]
MGLSTGCPQRSEEDRASVFCVDRPEDARHLVVPDHPAYQALREAREGVPASNSAGQLSQTLVESRDEAPADDSDGEPSPSPSVSPPSSGGDSPSSAQPAERACSALFLQEFRGPIAFLGESVEIKATGQNEEQQADEQREVEQQEVEQQEVEQDIEQRDIDGSQEDHAESISTEKPDTLSHNSPHLRHPTPEEHTHSLSSTVELFLFDDGFVSDDEGPRETGRISPCTFAHWAQGTCHCRTHGELKPKISKNVPRRRPDTPAINSEPERDRTNIPRRDQQCESDGAKLTEEYDVPSDTSPVWTAPGVMPHRFMDGPKGAAFERMNPNAGRELRIARYGELNVPSMPPLSTAESFTLEEVNAAVLEHPDVLFDDIPGAQAESVIHQSYAVIAQLADEDKHLQTENFELRSKLRERQSQLEAARTAAAHLAAAAEAHRRARIREHVAVHLRDLRHEIDTRFVTVSSAKGEGEQLREELVRVEAEIQQVCHEAGRERVEELVRGVKGLGVDGEVFLGGGKTSPSG